MTNRTITRMPDQALPGEGAREDLGTTPDDAAAVAPASVPLKCALMAFLFSRTLLLAMTAVLAAARSGVLGLNLFSKATAEEVGASFVRWDGQWYLRAMHDGWGAAAANPDGQSTAPFFPLIPGVMKLGSLLGIPPSVTGLIFVNAAFIVALYFTWRLAERLGGVDQARRATWAVAFAPFSIVFSMLYPDAIFLAASAGGFYACYTRRIPLAGVALSVATLVRPNGIVLTLPLALLCWEAGGRPVKKLVRMLPLVTGPVFFAVWAYLLYRWAGSPFAFASSKTAWRELPLWEVVPGVVDLLRGDGQGSPLSGGALFHLAAAAVGVGFLWYGRRALDRATVLLTVLVLGIPTIVGIVGLARYTSALFPVYLAGVTVVERGSKLERWVLYGAGLATAVTVGGITWDRLVP